MIYYRKATPNDCSRVMEIIRQAQARMRTAGSAQWQNGYPAPHDIATDIARGYGMVAAESSETTDQDTTIGKSPMIFGITATTTQDAPPHTVSEYTGITEASGTTETDKTAAENSIVTEHIPRMVALAAEPASTESIVAYAAVVFDGEPAYDALDGTWLCEMPYVVVHRLAVADHATHRGVATRFMRHIEAHARTCGVGSFRVDTAYENLYMQRMLTALGFIHCGEVLYGGGRRMAFEKLISQ